MAQADEKRIATHLARIMGLLCVRNSLLDDAPAGIVPASTKGDNLGVVAIDATGREIPWAEI